MSDPFAKVRTALFLLLLSLSFVVSALASESAGECPAIGSVCAKEIRFNLQSALQLAPQPDEGPGNGGFFKPVPPRRNPTVRPLDWETGVGKSYAIPALEVPAFLIGLNLVDRVLYSDEKQDQKKTYSVNLSTTWDHLRRQNWQFDDDAFDVNQFAHPYQGSVMYGLARSTGLNFWESLVYSNVGSFLWEMGGETTHPSINDAVITGNAGSLLGEALFRIATLVLKEGDDTVHHTCAALLSPPTAFNRHAFGERFAAPFPDQDPALFWRLRLGLSLDTNKDIPSSTEIMRHDVTADISMIYGLPGKPGYSYRRPLDYFDLQFQARARTDNPVDIVALRGLLFGKSYEHGEDYRGIWGLYGSYDYIAPSAFRISTMAASLGTTAQYWMTPAVALQGSLLGGVGLGAAGRTPVSTGERDYHYGVTPQGLLSLRVIFGDRALLYLSGAEYYVSGTGSDDSDGSETIFRGNAGVTVRVFGRHGIGAQYVYSSRDASYGSIPRHSESEGSVSITYTFLGDSRFGAVRWR